MGDLLPNAWLEGMTDSRAWTAGVADRLAVCPPLVPPVWMRQLNGMRSIHIQQRGSRETLTISLIPYPERVRLEVWTTAWEPHLDVRYHDYHDLVTWVGWTLIHPDPEAASLRLVVQSYRDAQAELEDR